MLIVIHIPEVVKSLDDYEFSHNAPTVDLEAILEYICNEYVFGTSKVNEVLLECLESLSNVRDCDHCDIAYNKLVSEIYNLILTLHKRLDEYMLREHHPDVFNELRIARRWRDLYVFELK